MLISRNLTTANRGSQPRKLITSVMTPIPCKTRILSRFTGARWNLKQFFAQAVDAARSMGIITSGLSRGRCPYGCQLPSEIFCSGVAEPQKEPRMLGSELLFDNLVSDLQFFCQLKTVQAGVLRTWRG
jgi:hypothetical protein